MSELSELLQAIAVARGTGDPHALEAARGALHRALRHELPTDPLVAASCLAEVEDPELQEALRPRAAVGSRTAAARALVVDNTGTGHVVELVVELSPGGRGVWTPQAVARDAAIAAQLAVVVALGAEAERMAVRWQVKGVGHELTLRGSSAALALAMAATAARRGLELPATVAFTGGVDLDGGVASVASVPAKVRAAAAAGIERVFLPASDLPGLKAPEGLELVPARQLPTVVAELLPRQAHRAAPPWRYALLALPALVAWTGALDVLDGLVQPPILAALHGDLPAENTVILPLPDGVDRRSLRAEWPRVLDVLASVGATGVVFDVLMLAETEHDEALAASIAGHEALGMPSVLATRWTREGAARVESALLASVGRRGVVEVEQDAIFGRVRRLPVRLRSTNGDALWHLAVEGLRAHLREPSDPRVADGSLAVGVTRNPVRSDRVYLPAVQAAPRLAWDRPESWEAARGRLVLIGAASGSDDLFSTPRGPRYGVEIHAAAVEALARQATVREGSRGVEALLALVVALGTAVARLSLPRRLRALALGVPVAALAGLVAAAAAGSLYGWSAVIVAGAIGIWAAKQP